MKNVIKLSLSLLLVSHVNVSFAYESTYERISWEQRGTDRYYCIDITDDQWRVYPGYQAIACGEDLYSFSPQSYVRRVIGGDLPDGVSFNWRVWSPSGYGQSGYEGRVTVGNNCQNQAYSSNSNLIQWGCRLQDSYYCVDILDANQQMLYQAAACGEGLHNFSPASLNLEAGQFNWQVWSASNDNPDANHEGLSGTFTIEAPQSPVSSGAELYMVNCASCHGNDPFNRGRDGIGSARNPASTRAAIQSNKGGMAFLSFLTDDDLSDMATYLSNPPKTDFGI